MMELLMSLMLLSLLILFLMNKDLLFVLFFLVSFLYSDFFDDYQKSTSKLSWEDSIPCNMPIIKKPLWRENGLFRKYDMAPKSRLDELKLRKTMMQWHQKLALLNLGLMAYQVGIGKKIDEEPNEYYDKYQQLHKNLGYTSFTIYMTSAGLSIFSPPALKYDKGLSSMKLHRYLSLIHFTGMAIQPWLGYKSVENNYENYDYYIDMHRDVGQVVFASYLFAFLLTLLPS